MKRCIYCHEFTDDGSDEYTYFICEACQEEMDNAVNRKEE